MTGAPRPKSTRVRGERIAVHALTREGRRNARRALWVLTRLRVRGGIRKQWRRLKRPSGFFFALLGFLAMAAWIGSLILGMGMQRGGDIDPERARLGARLACTLLAGLSIVGAMNHRGLYLPHEEIERLLASPVRRGDLVRYRMRGGLLRALLSSVLLGTLAATRMPVPFFGFVGAVVSISTLPILGQGASLLAGAVERRMHSRFPSKPFRLMTLVASLVIGLLVGGYIVSVFSVGGGFQRRLESWGVAEGLGGVAAQPWVRTLTWAFDPWARVIAADGWSEFLRAGGIVLGIGFLLFEAVARLPIDFRELSLRTSADVAQRLNRQRRLGLGASASKATAQSASWRVPWWLGRGPFGAIAWRKTAGIVRKARGTFVTSAVVLAFLTLMSLILDRSEGKQGPAAALGGAAFLVVLGNVYLCSGLRFDFRDDLDRMEQIKSWPLKPRRIFMATLLPEVFFVNLLLTVAILVRSLAFGSWSPWILLLLGIQPAMTFAWVALDNAVFLMAPVRYLPGQEGALQHSGRALVMMFVRMLALAAVLAVVALGALPGILGHHFGGWALDTALALGVTGGVLGLLVCDGVLVRLGGALLTRFDVARDRD